MAKRKKGSGYQPKRTSHHLRARSRGGADKKDNIGSGGKVKDVAYPPNELLINDKDLHRLIHHLFYNDRVSEGIAKLLFCWNTVNPHLEVRETNTWPDRLKFKGRTKSWDKLFGENYTKIEAVETFIVQFALTDEDKELVEQILEYALSCKIINKSFFDKCFNIMYNNGN